MTDIDKLVQPDSTTMFALMDDAAQRMNESLARIGDRTMTTEEHAGLVQMFRNRNAMLHEQIQALDSMAEKMEREHREATERMDALFEKQTERWAKHSRVLRAMTWFTWIMFWVSGFAMRGAVDRWL